MRARRAGCRACKRGGRKVLNAMMDVLSETWVNCLELAFLDHAVYSLIISSAQATPRAAGGRGDKDVAAWKGIGERSKRRGIADPRGHPSTPP